MIAKEMVHHVCRPLLDIFRRFGFPSRDAAATYPESLRCAVRDLRNVIAVFRIPDPGLGLLDPLTIREAREVAKENLLILTVWRGYR